MSGEEETEAVTEPFAKVDKWDGSAVKNALDDAVRFILVEKLEYREHHRLMDIRLAICLTAVSAAMFALVWDFLNPFPASKPVLVICVISYFLLMALLTLYTTMVEKGIFLETLDVDPTGVDPTSKWTLSSNLPRFDHKYSLCLELKPRPDSNVIEETLEESVSKWFTEDGELLFEKFESEVMKLHNSLFKRKNK